MNNNYNILIIDDTVEIIDLIEIYLENEGYHVYKALNGAEGLKILECESIHLVVLDIMMPDMDGLETCNAIMYGKKGKYVDIKLYQENDSAVIQVINYGEPIPESDIPHVFEKLYRVDKSQSLDGGTGIGLAIVKSITDLHKGSINVVSTERETVFEVRLACT